MTVSKVLYLLGIPFSPILPLNSQASIESEFAKVSTTCTFPAGYLGVETFIFRVIPLSALLELPCKAIKRNFRGAFSGRLRVNHAQEISSKRLVSINRLRQFSIL